jgi:hypothetical protein
MHAGVRKRNVLLTLGSLKRKGNRGGPPESKKKET